MTEPQFDIFLAHRSQDKPIIRKIYKELEARGYKPWFDEEQIAPGTQFQAELEQAIGNIKTAAICLGQGELGRWQALELRVFISQCVRRNIPVIPVLLPGVKFIPKDLIFLNEFHAVFFGDEIADKQAFFRLQWGIDRCRPASEIDCISFGSATTITACEPLYSSLESYLKLHKWKEADDETYRLMINAVGKRYGRWFDSDMRNFPREPLKIIDALWLEHSKNRFGFSIQKKMYIDCGGIADGQYYAEAWHKLCRANGWQQNGKPVEATFDIAAPRGHLPLGGGRRNWRRWRIAGDLYLFSLLSHPDL